MPVEPNKKPSYDPNQERHMSPDMELAVGCTVPRERPGALQDYIQHSFETRPPTISRALVDLVKR